MLHQPIFKKILCKLWQSFQEEGVEGLFKNKFLFVLFESFIWTNKLFYHIFYQFLLKV